MLFYFGFVFARVLEILVIFEVLLGVGERHVVFEFVNEIISIFFCEGVETFRFVLDVSA